MTKANKRISITTIAGIVFILIGLISTANAMDYMPGSLGKYLLSRELLLILIGLVFISKRMTHIAGWVLLLIGTLFLLDNYGMIPDTAQEVIWAVILIAIGVAMLIRTKKKADESGTAGNTDNE
ncbi:MAG: hypothetical protein BRD50_06140 [Bacteroidetes bacterium SW_11_45_7]|nr:MAG: hypothetical protein BRD50_06140 [Bacteroidetes bacterium SW_11_45_7]